MKKPTILLILLAVLLSLSACAVKAGSGTKLSCNIARIYTPATRESRFVMNGELIDGSVTGKAYFTASADGRTTLAWVDTVLYFVSENGIDSLGTGISTAEISFDGKTALWFQDNSIKRYSLDTREIDVLDTGVSSVIQFAESPGGNIIMFTASYEGDEREYRTKMYKDGVLTEVFGDITAVVLAVSDDAGLIYYSDLNAGFCVEVNGEKRVISTECGAATNYNFTRDLGEVIFNTDDMRQVYYRLRDGRTTEIGHNFGYTLKTDVYGISDVNMFCYTNDIDTFENGLFMTRETKDETYLYTIGLIDKTGNIGVLVESTEKYEVSGDNSRIFWVGVNGLMETDMKGNTKQICDTVVDFAANKGNSTGVYYISGSNTLFYHDRSKRDFKVGTNVTDFAITGFQECAYISNGGLYYQLGQGPQNGMIFQSGAVRFDTRAGQILYYADPVEKDGKTTYTLYVSTDAKNFTKLFEGVEP